MKLYPYVHLCLGTSEGVTITTFPAGSWRNVADAAKTIALEGDTPIVAVVTDDKNVRYFKGSGVCWLFPMWSARLERLCDAIKTFIEGE